MTFGTQQARTVIGAILWLLTWSYFGVQLWVARVWDPPYDVVRNTISDLGVTDCGASRGLAGEVYACSPRHLAMNVGFIVSGLLTAGGAVLLHRLWPADQRTTAATVGLVMAGIGGVLVGLAPSNEAFVVHAVGALLQVPGAAAPLLLGLAVLGRSGGWFARAAIAVGAVGLIGAVLFLSGLYFGAGRGIMERIFIETHTVWTGAIGLWLLVGQRSRPMATGSTGSPVIAD